MKDPGDLNRILSDAVNNDEREARDNHFPRVRLGLFVHGSASLAARRRFHRSRLPHVGLRRAETVCGVIADMQKVIRSGCVQRTSIKRDSGWRSFCGYRRVRQIRPGLRRQALIDFARKPLVIIPEAFDRLLHKRFRRFPGHRHHCLSKILPWSIRMSMPAKSQTRLVARVTPVFSARSLPRSLRFTCNRKKVFDSALPWGLS
jgi:hypothetical protein